MLEINNLPFEILDYILSFIDKKFKKKIRYKSNNIIEKLSYIPADIALVNKKWYNIIIFTRCKICNTGSYNNNRCSVCCHMKFGNKKIKLSFD